MQQPPNERPGQEDAEGRAAKSRQDRVGIIVDHKAIIAVVLFVVLGTLAVYVGFQTLPAPKNAVMEPMLGMADGKMDSMSSMSGGSMKSMPTMTADSMGSKTSMPTATIGAMDSMPGMAAGNPTMQAGGDAHTLQQVEAYFRDTFSGRPDYAMISGYTVDHAMLTIHTHIDGVDGQAKQAGPTICGYADQLLKHGGTAIEQYSVLNHEGDKLCGGP